MRRSILLLGGLLLLVDLLLVPRGCQYLQDAAQKEFEEMLGGCAVPPSQHAAAPATNASEVETESAE